MVRVLCICTITTGPLLLVRGGWGWGWGNVLVDTNTHFGYELLVECRVFGYCEMHECVCVYVMMEDEGIRKSLTC